jgi:hypothetical protein
LRSVRQRASEHSTLAPARQQASKAAHLQRTGQEREQVARLAPERKELLAARLSLQVVEPEEHLPEALLASERQAQRRPVTRTGLQPVLGRF